MSTMLYRKQEVEEILAYLCSNYGGWKQVIKVFKDKKRINLENNGLDLYFTLEGLNPVAVSEFTNFLHFLEQKSYLRHLTSGSGWARLSFKSSSLKRFLMTTGSWLEALTYLTVENIKGINEAQSGVVFLWDKESEFVRNELDVIATLDSNLICISCKDTEDLETSMLNELEVYAQRIGGENTIKLLVTSSPCQNVTLLERADEMGIDIVYFNGNLELFEKLMADRIISSS